MEHSYPLVEFETEIQPGGRIVLPPAASRVLAPGSRVTLRITRPAVSPALRRRSVSENEVEQIALAQLEAREHVIRFLEAEGGLASDSSFMDRVKQIRRR